MAMKISLHLFLISLIDLSITATSYAQANTTYAGLNFTVENAGTSFRPGTGASFERQITKHSGIETGLYYRHYVQSGDIIYTDATSSQIFPFVVSERYLSIPALYKFYSRIVNIAAGPSFDFYMGWKQRNRSSGLKIENYDIDPNFHIGFLAKISKRISLSDRAVLEPELRINPMLTSGRSYAGFGIAGKYRL